MGWNLPKRATRSYQQERNPEIAGATSLAELGALTDLLNARGYFLPALFAAQYAFNLADNFALVAALNAFFWAAGLTERVVEGSPI
jgi:hypothetical protein